MDKFKLFILETLPPRIARRIDANYERPEKSNIFASIIRLIVFILTVQYFIVRPYMVPTGSMIGTILPNDFLLVNRFVYGLRTPDNISIPFTDIYFIRNVEPIRITPELRSIKSNDVVVFRADHEEPPVEYVKRCVAIGGDSLRVENGIIYVNNKPFKNSENAVLPSKDLFRIDSMNVPMMRRNLVRAMLEGSGFNNGIIRSADFPFKKASREIAKDIINTSLTFTATLKHDILADNSLYKTLIETIDQAKSYREANRIQSIDEAYEESLLDATKMYQSSRYYASIQNIHNFKNLYIPKEGDVLDFDRNHFDLISNVVFYDGHRLDFKGDDYFIDGEKVTSYTVEQDYYFFIGDNRTGSLDSRSWGIIPRKYVSGAPILIYFNVKSGIWKSDDISGSIFRALGNIGFERIGKLIL